MDLQRPARAMGVRELVERSGDRVGWLMASAINVAEIERVTRSIVSDLGKEVGLARKKIVFQLFSDLVRSTPVLTGRARAGWTVSADDPSDFVPPEGRESYDEPDISGAVVALEDGDPFGVIWIVNNVVYIIALDEGHSTQNPGGMTAVAFANLQAA